MAGPRWYASQTEWSVDTPVQVRISPHGVRNREHYADPAARETAARLLPQPVLAHADPLSALFRLLLSLWKGRGLSAVGPRAGDAVTELLLGEGRRPDTDRIESELLAEGRNPARARRATVLGRPIEHNQAPKIDKAKERTPWLAFDMMFRPPPTAHMGARRWRAPPGTGAVPGHRPGHDAGVAGGRGRADPLGERRWAPKADRDGLIIAVFRHYESRAGESKPLLHDHACRRTRERVQPSTDERAHPRAWPGVF